MKNNLWLWAVTVVAILYIIFFVAYPKFAGREKLPPPPKPIASPEATSSLPRVITLYQKGDGESDLAAFVAQELAGSKKVPAIFRSINVLDEPQMVEFYGVSNTPAVIFLRANGKLFKKYEGYLDKARIIAVLSSMDKN